MPPNPHKNGNVTTVVIEMEPGWMFFKVAGPKPEPNQMEFFLRRAIEDWFAERPTFIFKKAMVITNQDEMLGIHVWYDLADAEPSKKGEPVEFGIDVHHNVAAVYSREYIEAVVTDALRILPSYKERTDTLVVINPRKVAVILDKQANRGAVIQVALIEQVVEGGTKQRLQAWLSSPVTPFYIMHIAGGWFSSPA